MIQALSEMGYHSAAENLSRESGYELESPTVAAFRASVLSGKWTEAEQLLFGAATAGEGAGRAGNGLVLAEGVDRDDMRFRIRQQKFLELLEQGDYRPALTVLRNELTPLNRNGAESLSPLIMCRTPDDVKAKAAWDGAHGESRSNLLSQLSSMSQTPDPRSHLSRDSQLTRLSQGAFHHQSCYRNTGWQCCCSNLKTNKPKAVYGTRARLRHLFTRIIPATAVGFPPSLSLSLWNRAW